ncbi:MAG: DUF4352 domain-containing protein [Oscillospiraceae bacterium]|nr:DUF4352 domain-containing protein [Oscillospiraceae bacterium]MBQ7088140.1 DUF4352 domain-containing protein [Clostridia bacterium]
MKHKRILTVVVTTALLLGLAMPVLAAVVTKTITVETDVKVYVNDKAIDAGDTHGNPEAFIYNGTTYIAAKAVSNSLGQNVAWDGNTRSVQISTPKEEVKDASAKTRFGVGEKVELKNVVVTLNSVTENRGANFMEPDDGNVFLVCEFDIENNSTKEIAVSSLLSFTAYVDDYAAGLSIGGIVAAGKNQLDGSIAAGKKMNGIVAYEVPKNWAEFEIKFTPDVWSGNDITFVATHE